MKLLKNWFNIDLEYLVNFFRKDYEVEIIRYFQHSKLALWKKLKEGTQTKKIVSQNLSPHFL